MVAYIKEMCIDKPPALPLLDYGDHEAATLQLDPNALGRSHEYIYHRVLVVQ